MPKLTSLPQAVIGSGNGSSQFLIGSTTLQGHAVSPSLGLVRTDALRAVLRQLADRLEIQIHKVDTLEIFLEKLSISCVLLELMSYSEDFRAEQAKFTQTLLAQGLAFLNGSQPTDVSASPLRALLRDLFVSLPPRVNSKQGQLTNG